MSSPEVPKLNDSQKQVYHYVLAQIASDALPLGSAIPTEMELARRLNTTRMNAHLAVRQLAAYGILSRNKRGGTRIARVPNSFMLGEIKRQATNCVTVLNPLPPKIAHIHWNEEIVAALEGGLHRQGLGLNVVDVSGIATIPEMKRLLRRLAREGLSALLCVSCSLLNEMLRSNPEIFFNYHRDVFIFARDIVDWSLYPYNIVSVDLFNEGVIAAEHALAHGYQYLFQCVQASSSDSPWFQARREGLRCGWGRLRGSGQAIRELPLEGSLNELREALASERRVMVVAVNDQAAVALMAQIAACCGKQAGRDYGLVSFDNNAHYREHRLTTIAPPLHEIGETLAQLILTTVGRECDRTSFIKIRSRLLPGTTS